MKTFVRLISLAGILLALEMNGLVAETGDEPSKPSANVAILPKQGTIGQPLTWVISFNWQGKEEDFRFLVPEIPTTHLTLVRIGQFSNAEGSSITKGFTFVFQPEKPGEALIHSFSFRFESAHTKTVSHIPISGSSIAIRPSLKTWLHRNRQMGIFLIAGSTLASLATAAFYLRKKKARFPGAPKLSENREEIFLQQLNLLHRQLETGEKLNDFISQLSRIFNQYLLNQWGSADRLFYQGFGILDRSIQKRVSFLLDQIEQAKFSGKLSNRESHEWLQKEIYSFIEEQKTIEPLPANVP